MRILIDGRAIRHPMGGVGYYARNLVEALQECSEIEHIAVLTFGLKEWPNPENIDADKVRIHNFPSWLRKPFAIYANYISFIPLNWLLGSYDIVQLTSNEILPVFNGSARVVSTIHDLGFLDCPEFFIKRNIEFSTRNVPKILKGSHRVVADSAFTKSRILYYYNIENRRVQVVHLGVRSEEAAIWPPDERYKKLPFLNKDYLVFVGTIEPRKNLRLLLDAYEKIHKQHDVALVIVGGGGWLNEAIKSRFQFFPADKLYLAGYVSDSEKALIIKNAKIMIVPSHYEGFGFPVIEAMKLGTPVIANNNSSLTEVVGEAGLLFEGTQEDLIAKIATLLNSENERKELRNKAFDWVKLFTWENTARQMVEIYQQLLANR